MKEWEARKDNGIKVIPASKFASTKTFYEEYVSGKHSGVYAPKNIYILGSQETFSAGYETLSRMIKCGATFAGVTPAQSGNCFGMAITPVQGLKNSKIKLNVSVRRVLDFPGDEAKGRQLDPDLPLDLQAFRKYNFDPNASVQLVLDWINEARD